ncbi:PilZ domain-containing protein [Candidatus Nitrospira bockiana]
MPPDAVTILLASTQAEDIMRVTKSLRAFYPGCRVEAVYSREEALEWASKQDWHLLLLDEILLGESAESLLTEIRRRAPRAAIIVMAERDAAGALQLMHMGADYCLFKSTPTFFAELPLVAREVLEKRDLRARLDLSQHRYLRLIDNLGDAVYELDAEGRFLYVSPHIEALLHFQPQELIGRHYSLLVPSDQLETAQWRFNERRSDLRATRRFRLRLRPKEPTRPPVEVEISAGALYDPQRRFWGTIGVIRPIGGGRQVEALQRMASLADPLARILGTAEQLLQTVRALRQETALSAQAAPEKPSAPVRTASAAEPAAGELDQETERFTERRQAPRYDIEMEARASVNGTTWEGTALNMSRGGIYLALRGRVDAHPGQPVRLAFVSEVGVLEIPAVVVGLREPHEDTRRQALTPLMGLAIRFSAMGEVEAKILQSLLEGLRTRAVAVKVSALLAKLPSSDVGAAPGQPPGPSVLDEGRSIERRQSPRVALAVPVHVEGPQAGERHEGSLLNLSATGAGLRLQPFGGSTGQRIALRFTAPPVDPGRASQDYQLSGEVVWVRSPSRGETEPAAMPRMVDAGVRFVQNAGSRKPLHDLLARYLTADRLEPPLERIGIHTEQLECRNERGQRLALAYDHPHTALPPGAPLLIVSPGFGETRRDYIRLGYYFAGNGFHVLRYDHSHHIGESDGGMVETTLTRMARDLRSVTEYAARQWPASPVVVFGTNLSARVAMKAISGLSHVKLLALVAPIVDLQDTLATVHQEDLISGSLQGAKRGISNILGYNIDADAWLQDATREGYGDLPSTLADAARLRVPVLLVSSQHDRWVRRSALAEIKKALGDYGLEWHVVPEPLPRLSDRSDTVRPILRRLVARCRAWFYPLSAETVVDPDEEEVIRESQIEQERTRLQQHRSRATQEAFWRDYLDRSHELVNFSDYWHLLDHMQRLLGPAERETRVLDAGCGNGDFAMFMLITHALQAEPAPPVAIHYVGLDLVPNGLVQARANLLRVAAELRGKFAVTVRPQAVMQAGLTCADLEAPLPFHDARFDRVVCSLVLGYLRDPLFTLRELLRVLSPGGKLLVTNFKPEADLSQLYRNFLSLGGRPSDLQKAKQLLEASGKLTEWAREGACRLFDRQELAMLLLSAGASQPRIYSTFANQAYVAVAEKRSP